MFRINRLYILLALVLCTAGSSCKKYLEETPNKKYVIPQRLGDLQAVLDYYYHVNYRDAATGEQSADDYYLRETEWSALTSDFDRRCYTWEPFDVVRDWGNSWSEPYVVVYRANTALDNLPAIERNAANAMEWDNTKGMALYFRSRSFFAVAGIWAKAYDPATADKDMGIPLRLNTDFNQPSVRASVKETYERIVTDLKEAAALLPVLPLHVVRPSRPAAFAMLSKVYLAMGEYKLAGDYADSCLRLRSALMDYNTRNAAATYPMPLMNEEVIFEAAASLPSALSNTRARIDSMLYRSYAGNDLRKTLFFRLNTVDNSYSFRGSYESSGGMFTGITTAEMFLNRAECYARAGATDKAMADLNTLLRKRWKTGTFTDLTATSAQQALSIILTERRKELLMRGIRWTDLKRLNREPAYAITLKRVIGSKVYELPPNDPRYAVALPEDLIELSGLPQNPR